ncbi:MAG: MGMT family protein [Candidatus Marinimicrobia bacterium]|nr:MGMT family protein [Candidatus Neomarinimicrobiota bacterium]
MKSAIEGQLFRKIIDIVQQIPDGHVATYGQIAFIAGTQNPRLVGFALATLKEGTDIPWFRVINSKGKISFPEQSDGFKIQYSLLQKEGIIFDAKNRINLKQFGWNIENG